MPSPRSSVSLGSSRNVEARHLYVVILHNLTGPKPVYYLVALSLFDPSPEIRADAREALRAEQLESARLFYIAALRSGTPALARRAAIALGEIGDPRGDSVPYLIDALVSYGTIASLRATAQYNVVYMNTIDATPGLKISDSNLHSHATGTAPPRPGATPPARRPIPRMRSLAPTTMAGSLPSRARRIRAGRRQRETRTLNPASPLPWSRRQR